jgi:hypothetical protein
MTSLGPDSRAIIDAALPGEGLDDARRAEMKRRLMAGVATGVAAGAVVATTAKVAGATGAGKAVAKGSLVTLFFTSMLQGGLGAAVVISAGLGYQAWRAPAAAPKPTSAIVLPAPGSASAQTLAPVAPEALPVVAAPPAALSASAPAADAPAPSATPAPSAGSITGEMDLLREAQRALAAGDSQRALMLLDQHERGHAGGALREERQAARVLALCSAGRGAEARSEATRFVAEFPRSPHRSRVLAACAAP